MTPPPITPTMQMRKPLAKGQLVKDEERAVGSVKLSVYGAYWRQVGNLVSTLLMLALIVGQGVYLASEWWLAQW